jgi:hypothetical protein
LVKVDVDVEAAAGAVCYGVREGGVGGGFALVMGGGEVDEGFGVGAGGFLGAEMLGLAFGNGVVFCYFFFALERSLSYVDRGGRFS